MRCWLIPVLILFFIDFNSPAAQTKWQAATVLLEGKPLSTLLATGVAFDHGHYHPGESFSGDFTEQELEKIRQAGFRIEKKHYHSLQSRNAPNQCGDPEEKEPEYILPTNYPYGSMNGYPTLREIYESLELMEALYPNLITVRQIIGDFRTFEGNRIYYVKISDNPYMDEAEPEVLYTALHHAREPAGMSQMLYFMWYLLENYNRDASVRTLVNERELFFIPCVNPDGYLYNEETEPTGGGFWRKNRNPNLDDIGTDLNRNYGYGWAYNNSGSSPSGTSDVFRGDVAFSEVETQAVKFFCENRDISIALNYHSHGNLLIIPWGYLNQPTEDSLLYYEMAKDMTRYNKFQVGTSNETLNYSVNGVSDDWMYGERSSKKKILAFTPEVGYAFWPNRIDIYAINHSAQYMNFMAAWNAGSAAHVHETSSVSVSGDTAYLQLEVSRTGIQQNTITLELTASIPEITFLENDIQFQIGPGETIKKQIAYVFSSKPKKGDSIDFQVRLTTGSFTESISKKKIYIGNSNWSENFEDLNRWYHRGDQGWLLTTETFYTAPYSLTDSPNAPMDPNILKIQQYTNTIDLSNANYAFLRFKGKWQMDNETDFAQIKVSDNGQHFEALCGYYTVNGTLSQAFDEPVYCGVQNDWVTEWIDLSAYLGKQIQLQCYMSSGQNLDLNDGIYLDDFEIYTDIATKGEELEGNWNSMIYPQPNRGIFTLQIDSDLDLATTKFIMTGNSGISTELHPTSDKAQLRFQISDFNAGIYILSVIPKKGVPRQHKIVIH
ncbi:MAG: immune inhibitor A [Saprospiraceae bacterium]|nr:immune inhibitor A [Saprospiraceae bacterium]